MVQCPICKQQAYEVGYWIVDCELCGKFDTRETMDPDEEKYEYGDMQSDIEREERANG